MSRERQMVERLYERPDKPGIIANGRCTMTWIPHLSLIRQQGTDAL